MTRVNIQIIKSVLVASTMLCPMPASTNNVISTPGKAAVVVTQSGQQQRVCYYDDKAYSIGAVLEVSGVVIQCAAENDFETNGALAWIRIKADE